LSVGMRNETGKPFQYYSINGISDPQNITYKFLNYNPSNITLNMTINNNETQSDIILNAPPYNFSFYDDVRLSFGIDDAIKDQDYFIVLKNIDTLDQYVLACQSQHLSDFSSFGWRAFNTISSGNPNFIPDLYDMQIFWSAGQDWNYTESHMDSYELNPTHDMLVDITNDSYYAPVRIVNNRNYQQGSTATITFETSFSFSTPLYAYFEQCETNGQGTTCTSYHSEGVSFTYTKSRQNQSVSIPGGLTASSDNLNMTTFLHVYAHNCFNRSNISAMIAVNITASSSSSSSSSLPPGAIVGIVCAGVLVLGLAAWWLCMRKPANESYKKLDD